MTRVLLKMRLTLDSLEQQWRALAGAIPSPPLAIGGVQFFAWDEDPQGDGTVICIGSNYSQYPTTARFPTKDDLGTWSRNYKHAAGIISGSWQKDWRAHGWLVGSLPPPTPRYFVMTNLVPWITSRPWTLLSQIETVGLINLTQSKLKGYLDDLAKACPDAFAVGHGIDEKTLPYLPSAVSRWQNWMLYPNLSHRHTPSTWDVNQQRFKF